MRFKRRRVIKTLNDYTKYYEGFCKTTMILDGEDFVIFTSDKGLDSLNKLIKKEYEFRK